MFCASLFGEIWGWCLTTGQGGWVFNPGDPNQVEDKDPNKVENESMYCFGVVFSAVIDLLEW